MEKIVAKDLVKVYNKKTVLSHVNIEMQGGVYGLLGPNGAGKSTLIGIMVDGIQNYSGEILYGNENIKKLGKEYRKRVGYVPQKQGLYEEFSVLECMTDVFLHQLQARLAGLLVRPGGDDNDRRVGDVVVIPVVELHRPGERDAVRDVLRLALGPLTEIGRAPV